MQKQLIARLTGKLSRPLDHKETFLNFTLASGISVLALLGALLLLPFIGESNVFFVFFVAVIICVSAAGLHSGIFSTLFCTIFYIAYLTIQNMPPSLPVLFGFFFFIIVGVGLSMIIDIKSNGRKLEEYKRKEKQYLEHLIELQKAHKKALADVKARDEFLSIVSHELKTPLTSMLLKLQTVLHNIRSVSLANFSVENLLKMLESAEQQSKRLSKMITDLLNVSLMTTGKMELEREKMDLSETIQEVADRFAEKCEKEGYKLSVHAAHPVIGEWDKLRIEQAVTNLIGNAIKYGKKNPITVTVSNSGGMGRFTVQDSGIGIPKALQEKVFARFGRAVDTHAYEGLGVGLYITQQIVHAHDGKLRVESKENHGSTFTVELPLQVK